MSKNDKNETKQDSVVEEKDNNTQKPSSYGSSESTIAASAFRSAKSLVGCMAIATAANRKRPNMNQLIKCVAADISETAIGMTSYAGAKYLGTDNDASTLIGSTSRTISGALLTCAATTQGLSFKKKAGATIAATAAEIVESGLELGTYAASSTVVNQMNKKEEPSPTPNSTKATNTKENSKKDPSDSQSNPFR